MNTVKRVIIAVLALFTALCISAVAGTDVKVNQDTDASVQNEPSITINHHYTGDLLNIVTAYNDIGKSLGVSYSADSGKTWADVQLPVKWTNTGDPSVASDNNGNVYACFLSYEGTWFTGKSGIYVCKSTDGGRNWSSPVIVDELIYPGSGPSVKFTDKCFLTVDTNSTSLYAGYIYVAWQRDDTNSLNSDIYFGRSTNAGASFTSIPIKINDNAPQTAFAEGAFPFVGADGDVYVAWYDAYFQGHAPGSLYVDKSTDGGVTFGTDVKVANILTPPKYTYGNTGFKAKSFPSAAADPNNPDLLYMTYISDPDGYFDRRLDWGKTPAVPIPGSSPSDRPMIIQNGNYVYTAWVDYRSINQDIYFNRSSDKGQNWDLSDIGPLDNGVTPGSSNSWQVQLSSSGNYVYAVWEDYRSGSADVYFNYSSNNGVTWQTDMNIDFGATGSASSPAITSTGNNVYIVWKDTRNGADDIYFNRSTDNGVSWGTPQRLDLGDIAGAYASTNPRIACDGNNVYCMWTDIRSGTNQIHFNYSNNNGISWLGGDIKLSQGTGYWCQMPIRGGLECTGSYVYACWAADKNTSNVYEIYFARSINSGANWSTEVIIADVSATSYMPSMSIQGNNVYIGWQDNRSTGSSPSDIYFDYSSDNGVTWHTDIPIRLLPGINSSTAFITSDGSNVYAMWYDARRFGMQLSDIYFRRSTDYGVSWGVETHINTGSQPVGLQGSSGMMAAGNGAVTIAWDDIRFHGLPNIYANNSTDGGVTWLSGPDEADVYCVRSTDGGASWQTPVVVNDDATDYAQVLPWVVVKENGMVDLSYYNFRPTPIDPIIPGAELRMAVSTNSGVSFNPSFAIQDTIVTPMTLWVGEYNGMAVLDTFVFTVFTDLQQTGNSDIFIDRSINPSITGCCIPNIRGDVLMDGIPGEAGIDIADLVYMVNYMFKSGPAPTCWPEANVNDLGPSDNIDIADLVYLVNYMFKEGPDPLPCP